MSKPFAGQSRVLISSLIGIVCTFVCINLFAQKPSIDDQWRMLSEEMVRYCSQKDWTRALDVIKKELKLAQTTGNSQARAGVLYNKACVHSLAGQKELALAAIREAVAAGYTDYSRYAGDSDFDSLRSDAGFKTLLAEIKAKYGPMPLEWDRTQPGPPFPVRYGDRETPELLQMRREFAIDSVVADAKDDYDRLKRLTQWTSTRWQHSSDQTASKTDPLTILREAAKGGRFICRDYGVVLVGVATAYGMPARLLNLLPRDVETRSEAHTVAEVWLDEFHKWVLADGQYGVIAELDGVPLDGVELQAALAADRPVVCSVGANQLAEWKPFILRNAYYFKMGDNQLPFERGTKSQLVLVPRGAPKPTKFAGGNEEVFQGSIYTSNPDSFYAPPPTRR